MAETAQGGKRRSAGVAERKEEAIGAKLSPSLRAEGWGSRRTVLIFCFRPEADGPFRLIGAPGTPVPGAGTA